MNWTAEAKDIVRRGYADNDSTRNIATRIGDGCTRNMVAGMANRMGLRHRYHTRVEDRRRAVLHNTTALQYSCQYPHGDPGTPDFRFCRDRVAYPGSPYCQTHRDICYRPREARA